MSHLTPETLARLVDEPAGADEAGHLAACTRCGAELEALRQQREMLAALPSMMPAPDQWSAISQRLRAEGLVRSGKDWWRSPALTRAAAAVLVFGIGIGAGWLARGAPAGGVGVRGIDMVARAETSGAAAADRADAEQVARVPVAVASGKPGAAADSGDVVRDVEQAEQAFRAALDRYMAQNATQAADPAARLAALDNIVLTTAEALKKAPADPVINGYYLTAVAQREAVLRQISASSGEPVF